MSLPSLQQLDPARFERADILRQLNAASRALAELKGVAASIPNQNILINTLTLQEARDSSALAATGCIFVREGVRWNHDYSDRQ